LVEVVRRDPVAASQLIQHIALFSTIGNFVVCAACTLFLSIFWQDCDKCDRPLRWWLLAQGALQLSQLPVRLVLLLSVKHVGRVAEDLEACVISLTASPAWRASKHVAMLQYGWFVLGMVWLMHTESCPTCPGIRSLTASVMLLSAARAIVALIVFHMLFSPPAGHGGEAEPQVVAATPSQIAALPIETFSMETRGAEGLECSICLAEYSDGNSLRRLPCGHNFHRKCIDKWLQRNKRCPLCVRAVDEEPCGCSKRHQAFT